MVSLATGRIRIDEYRIPRMVVLRIDLVIWLMCFILALVLLGSRYWDVKN